MSIMDLKRATAVVMAVLMALTSLPIGVAQAEMITTDQIIEGTQISGDRGRVREFLLREDVQRQLRQLGVDPAEAERRVASLSDAEIQQIAGRLDELPAGEGAVGTLVGAILIIFLVLLVTDLLGLTDVFPFVKKH